MNEAPQENSGASKSKKRTWFWIILVVLVIFFTPILLLGFFVFHQLSAESADAGFRKAKQTIDPEQLRAWALQEIAKNPTNDGIFPPQIPNSRIPSYIQKLYWQSAEDAVIYKVAGNTNLTLLTLNSNSVKEDVGYTNVTISWGGPFFHWFFKIGPTNYVPLPDSYISTAEWVPGIYYGREDTIHPIK